MGFLAYRPSSPADEAAVDDEVNARAEGSGLAGEEHGWAHHFIDRGHAPERSIGFKLLDLFSHFRPQYSSVSPYSLDLSY